MAKEKKTVEYSSLVYFWSKIKAYFVKAEPGKALSTNDYTTEEKEKLESLNNYELPAASQEVLGGVKVGAGLSVTEEGVLSANAPDAVKWEDIQEKPSEFEPAAHTHNAEDVTDLDTTMDTKIDTKLSEGGYQTADDVEQTLTEKGYQNAEQVEAAITAKGYQTSSDVQAAIAATPKLTRKIVTELPQISEADENIIYMVKLTDKGEDQNVYVEYMLVEQAWEKIGSSEVDLSGYLREEDLVAITPEEIDAIMAE